MKYVIIPEQDKYTIYKQAVYDNNVTFSDKVATFESSNAANAYVKLITHLDQCNLSMNMLNNYLEEGKLEGKSVGSKLQVGTFIGPNLYTHDELQLIVEQYYGVLQDLVASK